MPKFKNSNYGSPLVALSQNGFKVFNVSLPLVQSIFQYLDGRFYQSDPKFYDPRYQQINAADLSGQNTNSLNGPVSGGFRPLLQLGDEVTDLARPYQATQDVVKDSIVPLRGAGNIAAGVANIAITLLSFVAMPTNVAAQATGIIKDAIKYRTLYPLKDFQKLSHYVQQSCQVHLGWVIDGSCRMVLGGYQGAATVVMPAKLAVRGAITYINPKQITYPSVDQQQSQRSTSVQPSTQQTLVLLASCENLIGNYDALDESEYNDKLIHKVKLMVIDKQLNPQSVDDDVDELEIDDDWILVEADKSSSSDDKAISSNSNPVALNSNDNSKLDLSDWHVIRPK